MQTIDQQQKAPKNIRTRIMNWLGLTDRVTIKLYRGYGHAERLTIYGHVFRFSPLPRKKYRKSFIHNTLALLRLFMVKPYSGIKLSLSWENEVFRAESDKDGFFKFDWKDKPPLPQGWHEIEVKAWAAKSQVASAKSHVYIPYETQYGFISDIDDTFLISHSSNLRKRLFVLFTQNARSRKPFEGVVRHYQLLAGSNTAPDAPNPFFFVSSSEWNLYDYILEFTMVNNIPRGVFLLNQLKLFSQLLKTGQNHHQTKFTRIVRILEAYPRQRFVLLGDSSQQDPYIYEAIVSHFPKRIHAVYIRDVYAKNHQKAADVLYKIEAAGVPCCFFKHSDEAILHSKKIGLISEAAAATVVGNK
ncbi:MAG TPA: phosphatase domain-containing protein [Flavisolibacter sp.]|nr:phosphatase domain-containing protein [Flavisolibacter sp.]